ncbi:hypothetical protein ACI5OG_003183 [Salmonella enterica subsp. enterica serovar Derby]|nr:MULTISPECIES: hypothetical protein [Salmonella]MCL8640787.1 hypothetical protein [Salmonella enterica subsp. enterica serovar Enteritidis]MDR5259560.1 hypothetical protein [Salmonella enterica subsp. enterica serovar Meleagridis]CDV17366.1 Eae-like protein [Salmonella enterica subsp. enterica serovar Paratyphi A]APY73002.1 hypothetical protein LFZ24_12010 [Salmonella enterica subsp. enterica serovar Krefeld str. SA20030536]KJS96758.1 hypothetical protein SEEHRA36_24891 [Salmonella enterica 
MKERGITDGLTMNQLAERNAEHVTTIAALESRCAALSAKLSMINDLMEATEQANKLAQDATEKLVQERNTLAAENAGLKHAMAVTLEHVSVTDAGQAGVAAMIINDALHHGETPATDAFLAEVRAQGVEMFADKYRAQLTALPTTSENIFDAAHVSLRYQIFDADEFAAQLRKGVQS